MTEITTEYNKDIKLSFPKAHYFISPAHARAVFSKDAATVSASVAVPENLFPE